MVAPDTYMPGATIENIQIQGIILNVINQAIYWQLKVRVTGNNGVWQENAETYSLPGSTPISSDKADEIVGIRFRAAVPTASLPAGAVQASVSIRTSP